MSHELTTESPDRHRARPAFPDPSDPRSAQHLRRRFRIPLPQPDPEPPERAAVLLRSGGLPKGRRPGRLSGVAARGLRGSKPSGQSVRLRQFAVAMFGREHRAAKNRNVKEHELEVGHGHDRAAHRHRGAGAVAYDQWTQLKNANFVDGIVGQTDRRQARALGGRNRGRAARVGRGDHGAGARPQHGVALENRLVEPRGREFHPSTQERESWWRSTTSRGHQGDRRCRYRSRRRPGRGDLERSRICGGPRSPDGSWRGEMQSGVIAE